jgi:hypothetical protein
MPQPQLSFSLSLWERGGVRANAQSPLCQSLCNRGQDTIPLLKHITIPEAQHFESTLFQGLTALLVPVLLLRMLSAVELHYQLRLKTNEVDDIGPNRKLPSKLATE